MADIENLKPGMYVAVYRYTGELPPSWDGSRPILEYDGKPLRVESVCPPFVGVSFGRRLLAIDSRDWEVMRVSNHYARVMGGMKSRRRKKRHKEKTCPDGHPRCVRCGERLRQCNDRSTDFLWRWRCPGCDGDGGPVEVT